MRLLLYLGISIRKGLLLQFRFWDYKIFSAHKYTAVQTTFTVLYLI